MERISLTYPLPKEASLGSPQVLAIGHFDGVHLGHQKVISTAVAKARAAGLKSAVMTFAPHPREVLGQGGQNTTCLTPLEDKLERMAELGVDTAYIFKFDLAFAAISPVQFVEEVLRPLQVTAAVVGFDFSFGHLGEGTPQMLCQLGEPFMEVDIVEPYQIHNAKVSSTRIREVIAAGEPESAALLLGHPYRIVGTVEHGDGRGRTIGFPTANVSLSSNYAPPRLGVYSVLLHVKGGVHGGVMNVGVKPTFETGLTQPTFEVHIFDFNQDIYGEQVQVELLHFIRAERKFASVEQLIEQIGADSQQARQLTEPLVKRLSAGGFGH